MQVQIQTHAPNGGPRPLGTGEYNKRERELTTELVLLEKKRYTIGEQIVEVEFLHTRKGKNVYKVNLSK